MVGGGTHLVAGKRRDLFIILGREDNYWEGWAHVFLGELS